MPGPHRIEGYAIISADGMIADASGEQPPSLRIEADQRFFHEGLAGADAVAHGRHSGEGGPQAPARKRLILTRQIRGASQHPENKNAVLWNPAGASLDQAWGLLGLSGGVLAVIGGTDTFGHFLEVGYSVFYLTRVDNVSLPGGRPVFPQVPRHTPEELLTKHQLKPAPAQILDRSTGATLVAWRRWAE